MTLEEYKKARTLLTCKIEKMVKMMDLGRLAVEIYKLFLKTLPSMGQV